MKLQTILPTVLLTAISALSFSAYAADADKTPAADTPAAMPMKPHSHMQEKTGVAPSQKSSATAADEKSDMPKANKAKAKHLHPHDGK
jgi:hypothetical protein